MSDTTIVILANAFISGLFVYVNNYFPSYFKKKGENLATKEDIEGITKIVEGVKLGNSKDFEIIKLELGIVSKSQEAIFDDERKSIIDFFGAVTSFYESNMDIQTIPYDSEGINIIREEIRNHQLDYAKLQVAHSSVLLFCSNDKLIELIKPVILSLLEFTKLTQVSRRKIEGKVELYISEKTFQDKHPELIVDRQPLLHELLDEIHNINIKYLESKSELFEGYFPKYRALLMECKGYLKARKEVMLQDTLGGLK